MKLSLFSTQPYDAQYFEKVHKEIFGGEFELALHTFPINEDTIALAKGSDAICVFVNDALPAELLQTLHSFGVKAILLRCAGYNNVDLKAAEELGLTVANVPAYSPEAVAEFAVTLLQTLNRKTHRAYNRVREGNFNLNGLLGVTLHGKTVGVIGTGRIGICFAKIMHGFGCKLLAYDPYPNKAFEQYGEFTDLDTLLSQSDFVSLHCPLLDSTKNIINEQSLKTLKKGALLVNTSRGGLIDTRAVIEALKTQHLGGLALDVYDKEAELFYHDHSGEVINDDVLMRLTTFHNVLICGHQAFFTSEALQEIATTTLQNMVDVVDGKECRNALVKGQKERPRADSKPVRI